MVDLIMMRTNTHDEIKSLAENSSVPVINGLVQLVPSMSIASRYANHSREKGTDFKLTVDW